MDFPVGLFRTSSPSRLSCLLWLSVCALGGTAEAAQVQSGATGRPPRDIVQRVGRSTIRGRVLASDSGTPIRRATVRLTSPQVQGVRTTSTDSDGRYEFPGLGPGRYNVGVSKPAYVNWSYGQTRPNGSGKPIVLRDDEAADDITIRLPRGAVITGHVVDEFGEPVANTSVSAMRQTYSQGQRRVNPFGQAQTNDIGEYRLFGLTPGQYYVSASTQAMTFPVPTGNAFTVTGERTGFAPTFYPAASDVASAQKLTVGVAQTVSGIDIALVPVRLATISGIAVDSQGRALTNASVQVTRRGQSVGFFGNFGSGIKADGSFSVPNVTPGDYILRASAPRLPPAPGAAFTGPSEVSVALVIVNGEDVAGVRLAPITQVPVTGRILFDDPTAAQSIKASMIRVMTVVFNQEDSLSGYNLPESTVHDDFTFELKTFPARLGLRTFAPMPTRNNAGGWQVKSVRVNGADVTDSGVEVGGQGLSGVEIEMTAFAQQLTGTVTDTKGGAVPDYTVAVFSQDRARWTLPLNRYSAVTRPQDDGKFKVTTLPPGEYFAIALEGIDLTDWQDPDTLEGLSSLATPFVLTSGDTRTLDLRLSAP